MLPPSTVITVPVTRAPSGGSARQNRNQTGAGATTALYSTVTDFARLRGWSTSVPMWTAV